MAKVVLASGLENASFGVNNATRFWPPASSGMANFGYTYNNAAITCRAGGTASNLRAYVATNTRITSSEVALHVNGSVTSLLVTIAAGTTGTFTDTTNSEAVGSGDTYALGLRNQSGSNSLNLVYADLIFDLTSGSSSYFGAFGQATYSQASSSHFITIIGHTFDSLTIGQTYSVSPTAGTLSNMSVSVTPNSRTTNSTVYSHINGSDGNQTLTIPASTTGVFEDTTNSDNISVGDLINMRCLTGTGTQQQIIIRTGFLLAPSAPGFWLGGSANGGLNLNTLPNASIMGEAVGSATEADQQWPVPIDLDFQNLNVYVRNRSAGGTATLAFRINGADGNQSLTLPASTTGAFQDTTNTDSVLAGDLINIRQTGATNTCTIVSANVFGKEPGGGNVYNESFTESVTAADSFAASASLIAAVSDGVAAADTQGAAVSFITTTAEDIEADDALSNSIDFNAAFTEDVEGADAVAAAGTFVAAFSDDAAASDAVAAGNIIPVQTSDDAETDDSIEAVAAFSAATTDDIEAADDVAASAEVSASISDDAGAVDDMGAAAVFNTLVSEGVAGSDDMATGEINNDSFTETVAASDSMAATTIFNASISDNAEASDSVDAAATINDFIEDEVAAAFVVTATGPAPPSVSSGAQLPDWYLKKWKELRESLFKPLDYKSSAIRFAKPEPERARAAKSAPAPVDHYDLEIAILLTA